MGKGGKNMKFEIPTIIEYSVDELNELIEVSACSNGYCHSNHCVSHYSGCAQNYCGVTHCPVKYDKK